MALALAGPAASEPVTEAGYWSQVPVGATPERGLEVAAVGVARMPSSVTAIRATGNVKTITLVEASSVVAPGGDAVVIQACPSTSPWKAPAGRGTWAEAPKWDCTQAFDNLERIDQQGRILWVADVERMVRDGMLDVVFVTGPGNGPFTISFQPPDDQTVTMADPVGEAPSAAPPLDLGAPIDVAAEPGSLALGEAGGGSPFAAPTLSYAPEVAPAAPLPAAAPRRIQTAPVSPAAAALPDGSGGREPLALLAVAIAVGAWIWRFQIASVQAAAHPLATGIAGRATPSLAAAGTLLRPEDEAP